MFSFTYIELKHIEQSLRKNMEKILMIVSMGIIPFIVAAAPSFSTSISDDGSSHFQWILNAAFMIIGVLGGWVLKFFHERISTIEKNEESLFNKLHMVELLVAGQYVKREDLDKLSQALFAKLDKIELKLDSKVDKEH
jgi:hypothetical protein